MARELVLRRIKSCPSTQSIDGFESGCRNQPWSRVARYSTPRPHAQRSRKGFVHRFLGKIKIAEQADQSCQDSPRIRAIKGVEQFAHLLGGTLGHDDDLSKPAAAKQFGKRRRAIYPLKANTKRPVHGNACRRSSRYQQVKRSDCKERTDTFFQHGYRAS